MADLGNKANPFLAGLTGLGEGLLQGYLTRMKMNQEQQQIDFQQRRMSMLDLMNQRQDDLQNEFRQKDYELNVMQEQRLSRPPEKKAFLDSYKEGYTTEGENGLPVFHPFENLPKESKNESGLTPYQQEMQDRYNEKQEEKRSAGQTYYNERMDLPYYSNEELAKLDPNIKPNSKGKGAFVKKIADGEYEVFYSAKSLESATKKELIQKKLYTKGLNFWKKEDPSEQKTLSQSDFIKDFESDQGRKPSATELIRAKQKGIYK